MKKYNSFFTNIKGVFSILSKKKFCDIKITDKDLSNVNNSNSIYKVDKKLTENVEYFEKYSKHRPILKLFDLHPIFTHCFIAPNATIVGEVNIHNFTAIGFNVVVRGDINTVTINSKSYIGDHTVINTVNSLPTGLPSICYIGQNVTINSRCSLVSCYIEDQVFIGHGSVILEGARVETGAVILPNSVVPPGRIIPAHQIWGGNPVRYVRHLTGGEVYNNMVQTYDFFNLMMQIQGNYNPYNYAYLEKESFKEDLDLSPEMVENIIGSELAEYKLFSDPENKHYLM